MKREVGYPALLSGREEIKEIQDILHSQMSKLCHAEVNFKVKLPPPPKKNRFFTSDDEFLSKNQSFKIRNESDSSSAGVVQLKEKEGRRGVCF